MSWLSLKGKDHWSKQTGKIHNAKINHPRGFLGKKHSIARNKYMSEIQKGEKNHFYGKHHSDETKKIVSEKAKNRFWITNGIESITIDKQKEIPNGWWKGRTLSKEKSASSMKWINNGEEERYIKKKNDIPSGWISGRLKGKRP